MPSSVRLRGLSTRPFTPEWVAARGDLSTTTREGPNAKTPAKKESRKISKKVIKKLARKPTQAAMAGPAAPENLAN